MVHPSDPRHPHGPAEPFGQTQVGVPSFGAGPAAPQAPQFPQAQQFPQTQYPQAGPVPQGSGQPSPQPYPQTPAFGAPQYGAPPQPQYQQPQYQQPQYPQPQHQQPVPQYGQPQNPYPPAPNQFGQAPFGQGQPGGPFPFGQPMPPKKSRTPLIASLVGLVVVMIALATVLIVAPWEESTPEESTETLTLDGNVSVQIRLPAGWGAQLDTDAGDTLIRIHQDDDDRPLKQVTANLESLRDSGSGSVVHTVVVFTDDCPSSVSSTSDVWTTRGRDGSTSHHTERWKYAVSKVDSKRCVKMSGVDSAADAQSAGSKAQDLLQKLLDEDRITVSKSV